MGLSERWRSARGTTGSVWRDLRRRFPTRSVAVHDTLVLLALWGLAVAQPVLDVFGRTPEFFVVNDLTTFEIVVFAVIVAVVLPLVLVVVDLGMHTVGPRVGTVGHTALVGLLGAAFGLTLMGHVSGADSLLIVLVGGFAGVAVAHLERTSAPLRTGLRYLALSPLLFLVAFLAFSPSGSLLRGDDSGDVEPGQVGRPAPVVVLSMDELPVASLMSADGTINAARFPNFARLAEQSSWYRNATTVSANTVESVPATLTGRLPEQGRLPTYRDHPRNLFTLLGSAYTQHAEEQVTSICPRVVCPDERDRLDYGRLRTSLLDAAAVYAHTAAPPALQEHLPPVDGAWGGFLDGSPTFQVDGVDEAIRDAAGDDADTDVPAARTGPDPSCPDAELWCGPARISELTETVRATERPGLWVVHATFPHAPWILSPGGLQYAPRTLQIPGRTLGNWADEPFLVRQSFQRHLLQLGYMDRLLGELIDRLEGAGLWGEALVVVVADHGVAFQEGESLRTPSRATAHEIYNIPLLIKAPGQQEGETSDVNALTIDVLPTIVDLLDIETDWEFDGQSLLDDGRRRADKPVVNRGAPTFAPAAFSGVMDVVERNQTLLPHGEDWSGVYGVGRYGDLVGAPARSLDRSGEPGGLLWSVDRAEVLADWDPSGDDLAPLLLDGRLLGATAAPDEALVVVNGTVAGAAGGFRLADDGLAFTALIAEETLRPGRNAVSLLVPEAPGTRTFAELDLAG